MSGQFAHAITSCSQPRQVLLASWTDEDTEIQREKQKLTQVTQQVSGTVRVWDWGWGRSQVDACSSDPCLAHSIQLSPPRVPLFCARCTEKGLQVLRGWGESHKSDHQKLHHPPRGHTARSLHVPLTQQQMSFNQQVFLKHLF